MAKLLRVALQSGLVPVIVSLLLPYSLCSKFSPWWQNSISLAPVTGFGERGMFCQNCTQFWESSLREGERKQGAKKNEYRIKNASLKNCFSHCRGDRAHGLWRPVVSSSHSENVNRSPSPFTLHLTVTFLPSLLVFTQNPLTLTASIYLNRSPPSSHFSLAKSTS